MNNIETLETDGIKDKKEVGVLEHELEASVEAGLSTDQLIETFNPAKLEDIIDNQAAEILELERDIERLGKLKALKIKKIQKWSAIQSSVKTREVTQESLDKEIAIIEVLNAEIQEKVDQIKAETK